MKVSEAIKKYNLTLQERDCFGIPYRYKHYSREEWKDGTQTVYTVEEDELAKEEGEELYFLIVQKLYHNQVYMDKHGNERIKTKSTIRELQNG